MMYYDVFFVAETEYDVFFVAETKYEVIFVIYKSNFVLRSEAMSIL